MAEQTTKQEVSVAQASKRKRRLAKSDIFSGISTTGTGTNVKNPSTVADLVEVMLIKAKDKEEYVTDSPDEKTAMVDRNDKPVETGTKGGSKVSKILKRVLSKGQEDEEPPDGDTSGKTQAQPKLSKLLKRVLKENNGSLERANSAEDTPAETNNKDESKNEEEPFELTPSAKGLLVRVLKKRAERRSKAATGDVDNKNTDEKQDEAEGDGPKVKASEGQRFEAFAEVLNRIMTGNTAGEENEDGNSDEIGKEEENNEPKKDGQIRTAVQGPIILTPSARGVLVRALRNRAELKKRREGAAENEAVDESKGEGKSDSQKQRLGAVAKVFNRIISEKRESEDRQDEDIEQRDEEKMNETNSEEQNRTAEQSALALTPAARGLLIRALRKRAVARKNKTAVSPESSNRETGEEANMENNDIKGEGQTQDHSQEQIKDTEEAKAEDDVQNEDEDNSNTEQNKPKVNRMVKRAFSKNKKRQAFQSATSQDEGFSGVVQRSIDLQDAEKTRIKEQEERTTEQENTKEDNTTPHRVLYEEKDAENIADNKEEEIRAKEANGDKVEGGIEGVEEAKEGAGDGDDDSPHVSTAESEPSSCSGACVII